MSAEPRSDLMPHVELRIHRGDGTHISLRVDPERAALILRAAGMTADAIRGAIEALRSDAASARAGSLLSTPRLLS